MISADRSIPQDCYINIAGVNTRYWQVGDRGSNIILLHGGNGSIEFWLYNILVLAQNHRVYAFDMVGSGRSDYPDVDYSLNSQAEFLRGFMMALSIESATLIGNSMGGGVSLKFIKSYPDRVDKLVLVDTMGMGREINWAIKLITLPTIAKLLRPRRWMIPAMLRGNFYNGRKLPPEWMELRYPVFAIAGRNRSILSLAQSSFTLCGVRPEVYRSIVDSLPSITQQTLIIWGENDRIIPVKHAYIAAKLPNNQLHIFSECGHHPYLEYPDRFNRLVLNFLK
jgi:pimeloyl-ACP methyl ester carboxylesterase